jgi:hypothetical protein
MLAEIVLQEIKVKNWTVTFADIEFGLSQASLDKDRSIKLLNNITVL